MEERRAERRLKVLKEGKVLFSDWLSVNCTIRDISSGGARLEFDGPVCLPSEFKLLLVQADLAIPCSPAWQRRGEAGVRFIGVATAGHVDNSPKRFVRSAA